MLNIKVYRNLSKHIVGILHYYTKNKYVPIYHTF